MSKRETKHYTLEFRQSAAKLALESDQPITKTADELGVHQTTLHGWVKRYGGTMVSKTGKAEDAPYEELKRLKKELARVKEERDILKKATAYFARETE